MLDGQPSKEVELDDLGSHRIVGLEPAECLVQRKDFIRLCLNRKVVVLQIHTFEKAPVLDAVLPSSVFYQNASHCLGGGSKKVPSVVPFRAFRTRAD